MKKIYTLLLLLIIYTQAYTQLPVSSEVIQLQEIKALQGKAVILQDVMAARIVALEAKETVRTAVGVVETLETIKQIQSLLSMFVCQLQELNINMAFANSSNCLFNLKYNMTLLNIQQSTDFIKVGIVGKNLFTQAERLNFVQTITATLQQSIKDLEALNKALSQNILEKVVEKYAQKQLFNMRKSYSYSRY